MTNWVKCPICLEDDMRAEVDGEGVLISCVNLSCGSNGGDNFEGVQHKFYNEGITAAAGVICGGCARGEPLVFQRHQVVFPPDEVAGTFPCVASRIVTLKVAT